jgi:hypothetical protein
MCHQGWDGPIQKKAASDSIANLPPGSRIVRYCSGGELEIELADKSTMFISIIWQDGGPVACVSTVKDDGTIETRRQDVRLT